MVLQAVVTAELDRQWIEDGLAAKWPDVQRQIAAASEQIQALKARSETEKVYAVLDVATYKMRQIPPPGALVTFDSAPVVERVTLAAISAAPRQVAPHSVAPSNNLTAGTILESAFTFSVQVWSRAEEAEQARTRERTQITDRLRQLSKQDAPPSTGTTATTPTTTTPSTGGPSLLPPVAQDAPSLLPGAPGEGPIQQAARSVEGARQAGLHLEREGAALLARIGSGPSPSAEERASFLRSEERWRLGVRYLINWYTKESREEAVQALKQLLGDDKMSGPKLQQLRTQLGG
jgi:hypothetical protein